VKRSGRESEANHLEEVDGQNHRDLMQDTTTVTDAYRLLSHGDLELAILEMTCLRKGLTETTDTPIGMPAAIWTSLLMIHLHREEHHKGPNLDLARRTKTRITDGSTPQCRRWIPLRGHAAEDVTMHAPSVVLSLLRLLLWVPNRDHRL
jgi:hypothetical protein